MSTCSPKRPVKRWPRTNCVTELVTNSIRHAGLAPADEVRIRANRLGKRLRVDVYDRSKSELHPLAGSIRPAPGSQSGWGLYLVQQVATRLADAPMLLTELTAKAQIPASLVRKMASRGLVSMLAASGGAGAAVASGGLGARHCVHSFRATPNPGRAR